MSDPFLDALNAAAGTPAPASAGAVSLGSRAVRNNSPGNLKPGFNGDGSPRMIWSGQTGVDHDGFATFDSPESGVAASRQQVLHDYNGGLRTPIQLATKYAPPGENNTAAYAAKLAGRLGIKPTDDAGLSDPSRLDTYMGQLYQNEDGGGQSAPTPTPQADANNGPDPFLDALNAAAQGNGRPFHQTGPAGVSPQGAPPPSDPTAPVETWGQSLEHGLADASVGVMRGITDVAGTIGTGVDKLGDATGLYHTNLRDQADESQRNLAGSQYHPDGGVAAGGRLGGDVLATAPVAEINVLSRLPAAGKLATGLRGLDLAAQGAVAGGATSGGHDFGSNMLTGAAFAPAAAGAARLAAPLVVAAAEKTGVNRIAQALRDHIAASGSTAADDAAATGTTVDQRIRTGAEHAAAGNYLPPIQAPEGVAQFADDGSPLVAVTHGPDGSLIPSYGTPNQPGARGVPADLSTAGQGAVGGIAPSDMTQALGSAGAKRGLEATTDLPAPVAAHVQQLTAQGVPMDQALREADITAAPRQVDNYRYAEQRRASLAARKGNAFAGRYKHHQEREADRLAAELTSIEQSPALLIVSAMMRAMDAEAVTRVLEQLAPGAVGGSKLHMQAVTTVKASRLNLGQQFDLMRAFERLGGEG